MRLIIPWPVGSSESPDTLNTRFISGSGHRVSVRGNRPRL